MLPHEKKLAFVQHMTKLGLQHFDQGGAVAAGGSTALTGPAAAGTVNSAQNPNKGILGSIGGALGLNNNFQAGSANIQAGTNASQLNNAYNGATNGLTQQQNLAYTLQPQTSSAVANQNQLSQQFQQEANGQGPNVAQNQLNQATGANVANQAALMAGQRGSSANAGLLARQAAQQGANTQQQAVGQAATLGAQQQIAAQQNEANLAANQINQAGAATGTLNQAQQAEQNILQGANTAYNNAGVGMQSNINNTNAQTAASNQNMFGNILGGVANAGSSLLSGVSHLFGAEGGEVNVPPKQPELGTAGDPKSRPNAGWGAIVFRAEGGEAAPAGVHEGYMKCFANGGTAITGNPLTASSGAQPAAQSFVGQWLSSPQSSGAPSVEATSTNPAFADQGWGEGLSGSNALKTDKPIAGAGSALGGDAAMGTAGTAQTAVMNGEQLAAQGGQIRKQLAAKGGPVKASSVKEKATVAGNSYTNDKIPAMLSEKEVVIPRSVMLSKDPVSGAAEFVRATLAKKGLKK